MRHLTLFPAENKYDDIANEVGSSFGFIDYNFIRDLIYYISGLRVSDSDVLSLVVAVAVDEQRATNRVLSDRKAILEKFVNTSYVLAANSEYTDLKMRLIHILTFWMTVTPSIHVAVCVICPFKPKCSFGKTFVREYNRNGLKQDEAYLSSCMAVKHHSCPMPSQQTAFEAVNSCVEVMGSYDDELKGSLLGSGTGHEEDDEPDWGEPQFHFNSDKTNVEAIEAIVKKVDLSTFSLLKLVGDMNVDVTKRHYEEEEKTRLHDRDSWENTTIKSPSEIAKGKKSDLALSNDMLDAKYIGGLTRQQNLITTGKDSIYYIMLDVSGSMGAIVGTEDGRGGSYFFSRSTLAAAICVSLAERQFANNGVFAVRLFQSRPGPMFFADKLFTFRDALRLVTYGTAPGGGTNIRNCFLEVVKDIQSAKKNNPAIEKAEILIISDGDDNSFYTVEGFESDRQGLTVNFMQIGKKPKRVQNVHEFKTGGHSGTDTLLSIPGLCKSYQFIDIGVFDNPDQVINAAAIKQD